MTSLVREKVEPWVPPLLSDDVAALPAVETVSEAERAAQERELWFKRDAVERLSRRGPGDAVMVLDTLERFYDDGKFWVQKNDGLHGNRCLVGGVIEASQIAGASSFEPAFYYLGEAIKPNGGCSSTPFLAEWNARCEKFATLRGVIHKARALARADQKRLVELAAELPPPERAPPRRWWRFGK